MPRVGRCLPAWAGRRRVLQLGMGQKLPHHLIVPLAIKRIKIGIGQQHERCGELIYQGGGIGNLIGIAAAVAVLWPVKDWWAGVKCEEGNGVLLPGDRGLQHRHIGQPLHLGNFRRVCTLRLRHLRPKNLAVILAILHVEWQAR